MKKQLLFPSIFIENLEFLMVFDNPPTHLLFYGKGLFKKHQVRYSRTFRTYLVQVYIVARCAV